MISLNKSNEMFIPQFKERKSIHHFKGVISIVKSTKGMHNSCKYKCIFQFKYSSDKLIVKKLPVAKDLLNGLQN